jgi:hypothetical protein
MNQVSSCEVDGDFYLVIPSRFPPVPLYTRLGDAEIQAAAEAVEAKTNPRLREEARLAKGPPLESEHQLQNWNLAPFAYANPAGTTFLGPQYRVLELVASQQAALARALLRREAFLASTEEPPVRVEMRLIKRSVCGRFADLSSAPPDPDLKARRELAADIYDSEMKGILFACPELGGGRAVAVFDGAVLGRAIQSDHYRFDWNGSAITKIGNLSTHDVIERDALFAGLRQKAAA